MNEKAKPQIEFMAVCAGAFAASVVGTIHFSHSMSGGMDMPGGWTMSMMWMPMPGCTWAMSAIMFLLMWLAMMVAMMMPSALPMLLNIRNSRAGNFGTLAARAAAGYFVIWTAIGIIVYVVGVAYALETMRVDWLSRLTPALSGMMLIVAGVIQFSSWKMSALHRCRAPDCGTLLKDGTLSGWRYGFKQGINCGVCCAGPMFALLILGMMNLTLMTIITAVITIEKLLPRPEQTTRLFGALALLLGLAILVQRAFLP
jgi:predicted metal-binding membrane protein